jgi:hypothetical protein
MFRKNGNNVRPNIRAVQGMKVTALAEFPKRCGINWLHAPGSNTPEMKYLDALLSKTKTKAGGQWTFTKKAETLMAKYDHLALKGFIIRILEKKYFNYLKLRDGAVILGLPLVNEYRENNERFSRTFELQINPDSTIGLAVHSSVVEQENGPLMG